MRKRSRARGGSDARPALAPGSRLLIADRPISSAAEDRLERGGLVDAITRTVERAPREGFVIGLAGPWGEGKSSVLNLVAEKIDTRGTAQLIQFNPWLFAETDELLERFFGEFAAQIKLRGGGERLARALSRYGRAAAPLTAIPKVGVVAAVSRRLALGGATLLRSGTSLHERRAQLERALTELDRPILVVVDDVDRLRSNREISEMIRLIRLVGDLPRVTYLVAYEPNAIARALGDEDEERGQAYLEKVVQAVFELPPIRRDLLERLLGDAVEQAVGEVDALRFSRERLTTLQVAGLFALFRNLRDIRRFAGALPAVVAGVGDEVELSDVLALEALRLLEPRVFQLIAEAVDVLTGHQGDLIQAVRQQRDDSRERVQAILDRADRSEIVRDLIRELFPSAGRHLGGGSYSPTFQGVWRRERRVAHHDVLVTYLERGLRADELPATAVEDALAVLDDRAKLGRVLAGLTEPRLQRMLGRLEDYEGRFKLEHPEIAIEELTAAAYRLQPVPRRDFAYDAHAGAKRLVLRILRGRQQSDVQAIVERTRLPNLSARADLIHLVSHEAEVGRGLVSEETARSFERQLVDAILSASADRLREEPELGHLLWRAGQTDPARTGSRLAELIDDPVLLIRWLAESMYEKRGARGVSLLLPWPKLLELVDQARLAEAVAALDDEWIADRGEREREAVRQAKHYSRHPDEAEADLIGFRGFSSEPGSTE